MKNTSLPTRLTGYSSSGLYLDLLKRCLMNFIYQDPNTAPWLDPKFESSARENGQDWPRDAHTMVGVHRLNNLQACAETLLGEGVEGDFVETGVWRGGASIFLRGLLAAHGVTDRTVWVADSFEGLPPPDPEKYPDDAGDNHHEVEFLAVSLEQVQDHFDRYGLLDDQVRFLKGWFRDTLPAARIERIGLLRLDGDMYESTHDALINLYHKVVPGGFIIVDDYSVVPGCKKAADDFRSAHGIEDPITYIDWAGAFWRKRI